MPFHPDVFIDIIYYIAEFFIEFCSSYIDFLQRSITSHARADQLRNIFLSVVKLSQSCSFVRLYVPRFNEIRIRVNKYDQN